VGKDDESGTLVIRTPVSVNTAETQGEACVILLHPPGGELGRRQLLSKDFYLVGRETTADLVIGRDSVSRRHAEIKRDISGEWVVRDLGSTNGTFVNEDRVERQKLKDGDQLRFGDVIYKFLVGSNVESAYHEEIYRMTIIDGLTGIHNKRFFLDFLDRELASAHRHTHPLTLVMFDIDHFKQVNDVRGHLCGDEVLKQLTNRIKPRIRREDLFARYGGEEFVAILTVTPLLGGIAFAEALRSMVARTPFTFEDQSFTVTVSLGVACVYDEPSLEPEGLIRRADENLYRAKRGGRNRVVPALDDASFS
jgi:two-component system, cell cycle response regulator